MPPGPERRRDAVRIILAAQRAASQLRAAEIFRIAESIVVVDESAGSEHRGPKPIFVADGRLRDIGGANDFAGHFKEVFPLIPGGIRIKLDAERRGKHAGC